MEKLNKFKENSKTVITAAIGAISVYGLQFLETWVKNDFFLLLILLTAITLIATITEKVFTSLVDNSPAIRRMILKKQFIEGYWLDYVLDPKDPDEILTYGIAKISYENGKFISSGTGFTKDFKLYGTWRTLLSEYGNYKMKYTYEMTVNIKSEILIHGFGEYSFTEANDNPRFFNGFLHDTLYDGRVILHGERIEDKKTLKSIGKLDNQIQVIKSFREGRSLVRLPLDGGA